MKGIGVDTVAMGKFENVLVNSQNGFIENVFTPSERKYCASSAYPCQSFAGHFAAKEALVKAIPSLRNRGLGLRDIEVTHNDLGAPEFVLNDSLKENMETISASSILLSISHTHETAVAMVAVV
jgi:holo-[acyl-carrier protein] synthase